MGAGVVGLGPAVEPETKTWQGRVITKVIKIEYQTSKICVKVCIAKLVFYIFEKKEKNDTCDNIY